MGGIDVNLFPCDLLDREAAHPGLRPAAASLPVPAPRPTRSDATGTQPDHSSSPRATATTRPPTRTAICSLSSAAANRSSDGRWIS